MSPQIHPSGFRISDRPVAASFAHPYSFQPAADLMLRDEACIASSVGLGGGEGTWVRYWDETSTIAMLQFEVEEPVVPVQPVKEKKEKRKMKGWNDGCPVFFLFLTMTLAGSEADVSTLPAPAEASALPVSDKPVTLSFSKGITTKAAPKGLFNYSFLYFFLDVRFEIRIGAIESALFGILVGG